MANNAKKFWKLQSFAAHDANVNCLSLGHKSGRVLATGGDDKKVNLWAVGKENCIMSLSGHATPIETVRFNHTEELIAAGSTIGVLKIWDLEAAKIVKTLTGHKAGITCIDFHPYGDFLCSGAYDSMIKLWDIRKKGCIATMKAHKNKVNSLRFSPDGQWIASCGEDTFVKLWDLRAGKIIHEFTGHTNSISAVEFHPHEFLLVSGGLDRNVNFFDLENFMLVSTEREVGNVKGLFFNRDGTCLFAGMTEGLKILGWEPNRLFDSVPVGWGKVADIAIAHKQLIGAAFHMNHVTIHIVDLNKMKPYSAQSGNDNDKKIFSYGQSVRKSFTKFHKSELISTNSSTSIADDITHVFQPSRALSRTPPPPAAPFEDPERDIDPTGPQIISDISPANEDDDESELCSDMSSYVDAVRIEPRSYELAPEIPVSDVSNNSDKRTTQSSSSQSVYSQALDKTFTVQKLTLDTADIEPASSIATRYKTTIKPYIEDTRAVTSDSEYQFTIKSDKKSSDYHYDRATSSIPTPDFTQIIKSSLNKKLQPERNYYKSDVSAQKNADMIDLITKSGITKKYDRTDKTQSTRTINSRKSSFPRSQSDLEQIFNKFSNTAIKSDSEYKNVPVPRQFSSKDIPDKLSDCSSMAIRHSASEANLTRRKGTSVKNENAFSRSGDEQHGKRQSVSDTGERIEDANRRVTDCNGNNNYLVRSESYMQTYETAALPVSVGVNDYFQHTAARPTPEPVPLVTPLSLYSGVLPEPDEPNPEHKLDEDTALQYIHDGHRGTMTLLSQRVRALRIAGRQLTAPPEPAAMGPGAGANKHALGRVLDKADAVLANDLLRVLMHRSTFWSLDMFVVVLPTIRKLLQSRVQTHISTALQCLSTGLTHFSHLLRTLSPALADSRDISGTERIQKCEYCKEQLRQVHESLLNLRNKLSTNTTTVGLGHYLIERSGVGHGARDQGHARDQLKLLLERVYGLVLDVVGDGDKRR